MTVAIKEEAVLVFVKRLGVLVKRNRCTHGGGRWELVGSHLLNNTLFGNGFARIKTCRVQRKH